jgi:hypothetical protein
MGYTLDRARTLVTALQAEGVAAAADPRHLTVPGLLVTRPTLRPGNLAGGWLAAWVVFCVAPGPDNEDSWNTLDVLVDAVTSVVDPTTITPLEFQHTNESIYPAYRCEWEEVV